MTSYKYQLIFFGDDNHTFQEIRETIKTRLDDLGVDISTFIFYYNEEAEKYCGNQPSYVIFSNLEKDYSDKIQSLLFNQISEGNAILPLYKDDFTIEVHRDLSKYNGEKRCDINSVVNHIHEGFDLLRRKRRIIISYKRSETTVIAWQLYQYFESRNFDVFLDTHTVPRGYEFQKQLWHSMTDSDIVILLDSPDFLSSTWCKEELAEAINSHITILRVIFPETPDYKGYTDLIYPFKLRKENFNKFDILSEETLSNLLKETESLRARSLASRQDCLITELIESAKNNGKTVIRASHNYLLYIKKDGESIVFIPTIGVPVSRDFETTEFRALRNSHKTAYVIYDDQSILSEWLKHIRWLNEQLRVKGLQRTEFNKWFKDN